MTVMARVLICEDEAAQRTFYQTVLEKAGHEVITAETGTKALQALEDRNADILVMDIRMPDMHGLELLENLRRRNHKLPIIVASALQALEDSFEVKTYGVGAFLAKPVEVKELVATVARLTGEPAAA